LKASKKMTNKEAADRIAKEGHGTYDESTVSKWLKPYLIEAKKALTDGLNGTEATDNSEQ
jgi:hypothetical protein